MMKRYGSPVLHPPPHSPLPRLKQSRENSQVRVKPEESFGVFSVSVKPIPFRSFRLVIIYQMASSIETVIGYDRQNASQKKVKKISQKQILSHCQFQRSRLNHSE